MAHSPSELYSRLHLYLFVTVLRCKREKGQEKYDITIQKLEEEDAAQELLGRIEAASTAHYNYSKVESLLSGALCI